MQNDLEGVTRAGRYSEKFMQNLSADTVNTARPDGLISDFD